MEGSVLLALGLTLFAGMATVLGSLIVFVAKKPNLTMLSFGLGLSSGVMVYVSLVELLPGAQEMIGISIGERWGGWIATAAFFGGIGISALIDKLVPEPANPHEAIPLSEMTRAQSECEKGSAGAPSDTGKTSLARVGLLSALAIGIHNFPEGMATFASSLADMSLGFSIAIAVAIHNIPEGIAVAVPIFFATGSRGKAFKYSLISGLAEPVGALLVYLVLMPFINNMVVGLMLAAVGGIMVFISFDELLPTAREYARGHTAIVGVVLGMAVMAFSLLLL
ncbi:MAG: zinc transporter ZupT [Deltaproteobacteria bacterium]|nr:zinc transporter ZupT [Deltaproteobacteria bacterium]MBN2674465.1 zinc transporter ZupT [Deltaproteobacteria bacterium]